MCTLHVITGDLNKQDLRSTYYLYIFPYFYKPYLILIMYPGNSVKKCLKRCKNHMQTTQ